jgi:HK97 family phage prohead protease
MMQRKTMPLTVEWKAGGSPGELEGYAAVFGNVDQEGDIVMPGAFKRTIAHWQKAAHPLPLIADHELTTDGVIGSVKGLREDPFGLWFKALFSPIAKAQDIRANVLAGHLRGTSYTYEVMRSRPGNGKARRFLDELRVYELTISPFPVNELAGITSAKASTTPWSNFTAADYTPAQYRRACLIDTGEGDVDSKDRYKLPVQVRLYGEIGEDPPDSLRRLAGMGAASQADWLASMEHAIAITNPFARKAALDELVASYHDQDHEHDLQHDLAPSPEDAPTTASDPAADSGTSPDDAYAASFLNRGQSDGTPSGDPPGALPAPLARLEADRSTAEINALEAELHRAMEA